MSLNNENISINNSNISPKKGRGRPPGSKNKSKNNEQTSNINIPDPKAPAIDDMKIQLAKEIIEFQSRNETIFKQDYYSFNGTETIQELNQIKKNLLEIVLNGDKDRIVQFFTSAISAIADIYIMFISDGSNKSIEHVDRFKLKLNSNQKRIEPHVLNIVKKYPNLFTLSQGLPIELLFFYELYSLWDRSREADVVLANKEQQNKTLYKDLA